MNTRVFKFGLFLIFGIEGIKGSTSGDIAKKITEITLKNYFHSQFMEIIGSMVSENEKNRPSFKQLSAIL